jgi:peptidoglycan/xylan/chitin deacetylase (PgdA/CDA1 family)
MPNRRVLRIAVPILVLFVAGVAWRYDPYRTVHLPDAINPVWWYRHMTGTDMYDPAQGILFHGNPNLKEVAITIDDGPHPQYGDRILQVLNQYHVKATFFVVGVKVKQDPQFLRTAVAEGDEIGNHTYDHQRLPALKPHEIANELRFDDMDIYEACGVHPTVMRPPGDEYNDKVNHVVKSLGYVDCAWTVAAQDFLPQTPQYIAMQVLDKVKPGAIILLHQDYPGTSVALPVIINGLEKDGYKPVTIDTMLAHLNVEPYASKLKAQEAAAGKPG